VTLQDFAPWSLESLEVNSRSIQPHLLPLNRMSGITGGLDAEVIRKILLPGHEVRSSSRKPVTLISEDSQAKQSHTPWWRLGGEEVSSYSFLSSALDGGEWSASRLGRALFPGKDPRYPLYRRLGGPQSRSGHRG
jgi:hypothetical protein